MEPGLPELAHKGGQPAQGQSLSQRVCGGVTVLSSSGSQVPVHCECGKEGGGSRGGCAQQQVASRGCLVVTVTRKSLRWALRCAGQELHTWGGHLGHKQVPGCVLGSCRVHGRYTGMQPGAAGVGCKCPRCAARCFRCRTGSGPFGGFNLSGARIVCHTWVPRPTPRSAA